VPVSRLQRAGVFLATTTAVWLTFDESA